MSNKMKEYTQGRMDGLTMAERLVKEGGLEALQKEIQTRGRMNIHTGLTMKELNFKEEEIGKGKYQIMMGETPILQYEGMYNKIQMYDVLTGMLIAKTDLGWK